MKNRIMKNMTLLIFMIAMMSCNSPKNTSTRFLSMASQERTQFENGPENDLIEERILTYEAYQTLRVKNKDGVIAQIEELMKNANGYILEKRENFIRFRLPADSMDRMVSSISVLGDIMAQDIYGQDVTDHYKDLELRLDNAEKVRNRYLDLLNKAEKVSDILLIEKELERLLYEIEKLKNQINFLDEQVAYSTFHVSIQEKIKPGPLGWVFVGLWEGLKFLFVWD